MKRVHLETAKKIADHCMARIPDSGLLPVDFCQPKEPAWKILNAIYEKRTDFTHGCDAIVQNCTGAYHDTNHHYTMNYGDYYFIEGVYKLKGTGMIIW